MKQNLTAGAVKLHFTAVKGSPSPRWLSVLGLVMSWSGSGSSHNDSTQHTCPALAHLRLPPEHLRYYLYSHPEVAAAVRNDTRCSQLHKQTLACWGYEEDCPPQSRYSPPVCDGQEASGRRRKLSNTERFWLEAGFGYVKEQKKQLRPICEGRSQDDSWLECSHYARYCRGRNIYLDFRRLRAEEYLYGKRRHILGPGEIGGHCQVHDDRLKGLRGHEVHGLMSWYTEMENFTSLNFRPMAGNKHCDVTLDTPTYFMKLDSWVNMYHHFCDFLNLYISQHVNGSFSTDVNIVVWDTSVRSYKDTLFGDTWWAFTDHPLQHLKDYDGKRVCVREAIFPLLPRMILGLYYNLPLVPGCKNSGLVRAFSRHVLYRLGIDRAQPQDRRLRVTFLSRSTKFRQVLNEDQLLAPLRKDSRLHLIKVDYDHRKISFLEQLQVTLNTDILIGIHGAGLTHTLFLPDWACLLEIYNCGDEPCYRNLAALRGVGYVTWESSTGLTQTDQLGTRNKGQYDYEKFVNYTVDAKEFTRLVEKAIMHVLNHPAYHITHMNQKEEL